MLSCRIKPGEDRFRFGISKLPRHFSQVCNKQRVAVLKNSKRENFNTKTEENGAAHDSLEREINSDEDVYALNARYGERKVACWQRNNNNNRVSNLPQGKFVNLRDIMHNSKYKIEMGIGRVLEYTSTKVNANDLKEAQKSCLQMVIRIKDGERTPDVGRKVQNFVTRRGVQKDRKGAYYLAGEIPYEEMQQLQSALEFSSDEEIDLQALEIEEKQQDGNKL